jgi:hypothetical protein
VRRTSSVSRSCDPQRGWPQIIARREDPDLKAEFIAKIGVVIEEANETVFWLDPLADSGLVKPANSKTFKRKQMNYWQSSRRPVERQKIDRGRLSRSYPMTAMSRDGGDLLIPCQTVSPGPGFAA